MILSNDPNTARAQYQNLLNTRSCLVTIVGPRQAAYNEAVFQTQGDWTRQACMAPDPTAILDLANQFGGQVAGPGDLIWAHSVHDRVLVHVVRAGAQVGDDRFAINRAFVAAAVDPVRRRNGQ